MRIQVCAKVCLRGLGSEKKCPTTCGEYAGLCVSEYEEVPSRVSRPSMSCVLLRGHCPEDEFRACRKQWGNRRERSEGNRSITWQLLINQQVHSDPSE